MDDTELLERGRELDLIEQLIAAAERGEGALLAFDAGAGLGKTTLLREAQARAEQAGLQVLRASGSELERDFPFGVVRQLFEPVIREAGDGERRDLLAGAAGLAAGIVDTRHTQATSAETRAADDSASAAVHGLYWLTLTLAERAPLLLVIDDLHWTDLASVRFVRHLAHRLDGAPVAVLLAMRPELDDEAAALVTETLRQPLTQTREVPSLSVTAVAQLIEHTTGEVPAAEFVAACQELTGGNPFFTRELLRAASAAGIPAEAAAVGALRAIGPAAVSELVLRRVGALSDDAAQLVQAFAVLDGREELVHAAHMAGLDEPASLAALDVLIATQILHRGPPLDFVHPVVRTSLYDALPAGRRSAAHARAAQILETAGADPDAVAAHLLATEPSANAGTIERLRTAARSAVERGAPEAAAVYLQRAAREAGDAATARRLQLELGLVSKALQRPAAIEEFQRAMALSAEDPEVYGRSAVELSELFAFMGAWDAAWDTMQLAVGHLGETGETTVAAHTLYALLASFDPRRVEEFEARLPELLSRVNDAGPTGRQLALFLAAATGVRGDPQTSMQLVRRGLDDGRFLSDGSPLAYIGQAAWALVLADELAEVRELVDAAAANARRTGSETGYAMVLSLSVGVHDRSGDLVAAEADCRECWALADEGQRLLAIVTILGVASDLFSERPEIADLSARALELALPAAFARSHSGSFLLEAQGLIRLSNGEPERGIQDLRDCGAIRDALGVRNPLASAWRPALALALAATEPAEALALAERYLDDAHHTGLPRGIGVGLRTLGMITDGPEGLALLEESARVLVAAPAPLERARTDVELGSALRRVGRRVDARPLLARGLDLAHECGATRLIARAQTELAATGARPRRLRIVGRDSLTPSEQRIAQMAAEGATNREIAQALFVTPKTVENHLSRIYRKLDLEGRSGLRDALASEQPAA